MGPQQMAGTPTQQALPPRQPGEGIAAQPPPSRADFFRKMLGDFFYAAGQGLSQAGHGPGSFGRGLGAGLTALPQRDILNQQLEIARQQAQGVASYHQAQAQALQNRFSPQTWIDENGIPHQISAQDFARLQAGLARTKTAQAGIDQRELANRNNVTAAMAKAGLGVSWDENGKADIHPLTREELSAQQAATLAGTEAKTADIGAARAEKLDEFQKTMQYKQWKEKLDKETQIKVAQLTAGKAPAQMLQTAAFADGGLTMLSDARAAMQRLEARGVLGSNIAQNKVEDWIFGKGLVDPSLPAQDRYDIGKLRAALGYTSSASMRAHTGRTSKEIYEDFKSRLGVGQDWTALGGALDETDTLLSHYRDAASTENVQRLRAGTAGGKVGGGKYSSDNPFAGKKP